MRRRTWLPSTALRCVSRAARRASSRRPRPVHGSLPRPRLVCCSLCSASASCVESGEQPRRRKPAYGVASVSELVARVEDRSPESWRSGTLASKKWTTLEAPHERTDRIGVVLKQQGYERTQFLPLPKRQTSTRRLLRDGRRPAPADDSYTTAAHRPAAGALERRRLPARRLSARTVKKGGRLGCGRAREAPS